MIKSAGELRRRFFTLDGMCEKFGLAEKWRGVYVAGEGRGVVIIRESRRNCEKLPKKSFTILSQSQKEGFTILVVNPCFLWSQRSDLNARPADYE